MEKESVMKRFCILVMITGLVGGSVATAVAKKPERKRVERTVTGGYQGPFVAQVTGCEMPGIQWGCLSIVTQGEEEFFTAKVSDAHGLPVQVDVLAHREGSHPDSNEEVGSFCGETTKPISFPRGADLWFVVGLGWIDDYVHPDCPAYPSTGTIRVTLSNLP